MKIYYLSFLNLFLFSIFKNIIRDLYYNIYLIEDMNLYETKYIPEGNKFYIKFPKNEKNNITFSILIPNNITLFPIYLSEFSKEPNDQEIINTNYNNELQLKDRDDQEYSKYSFHITNSNSYKVLYFKNNEILNYLSFYALSNNIKSTSDIRNLEYNKNNEKILVQANTSFFFRVQINSDDNKINIKITAPKNHSNFTIDLAFFSHEVTDDELRNIKGNGQKDFTKTTSSDGDNEITSIEINNEKKPSFLGIHLLNEYTTYIDIIITPNNNNNDSLPVWAIVLIVVGILIIIVVSVIFGIVCDKGSGISKDIGECCKAVAACCAIFEACK